MVPGELLHRFARWGCSPVTREQVVEPLLADLQYQWSATHGVGRIALAGRWYAAFWIAVGWCGVRGWSQRAVARVRRATPDDWLMAFYAIGMFLVAMAGPEWVRTGRVSRHGVANSLWNGSRLIPFIVWTIGCHRLAGRWRAQVALAIAVMGSTLLFKWLQLEGAETSIVLTALYIACGVVFQRFMKARAS